MKQFVSDLLLQLEEMSKILHDLYLWVYRRKYRYIGIRKLMKVGKNEYCIKIAIPFAIAGIGRKGYVYMRVENDEIVVSDEPSYFVRKLSQDRLVISQPLYLLTKKKDLSNIKFVVVKARTGEVRISLPEKEKELHRKIRREFDVREIDYSFDYKL